MREMIQSIKDLWGEEHYITFDIITFSQHERNKLLELLYKHDDFCEYTDAVAKKIGRGKTIIFFGDIAKHELFRLVRSDDGVHMVEIIFANTEKRRLRDTIDYLHQQNFKERKWYRKLIVGRIKKYKSA